MDVVRKGYYTVEYGGVPLTKADGSLLRVTSRDKCYSHILNDGRGGTFTIKCPDWEVSVEGEVGLEFTGFPPIVVPSGALNLRNAQDADGNWIGGN